MIVTVEEKSEKLTGAELQEQFVEEKNNSPDIISLDSNSNNLKDKFKTKKNQKKKNFNKKLFVAILGLNMIVLCSFLVYSDYQKAKSLQEKRDLLQSKIDELSMYTNSCKVRNLRDKEAEKAIAGLINGASEICSVVNTVKDATDIIDGFSKGRGGEVVVEKGVTWGAVSICTTVGSAVFSIFGPIGTAVGGIFGGYIGGKWAEGIFSH